MGGILGVWSQCKGRCSKRQREHSGPPRAPDALARALRALAGRLELGKLICLQESLGQIRESKQSRQSRENREHIPETRKQNARNFSKQRLQIWSPNCFKMTPNLLQNGSHRGSKIDPKRLQNRSRSRLGGLLDLVRLFVLFFGP